LGTEGSRQRFLRPRPRGREANALVPWGFFGPPYLGKPMVRFAPSRAFFICSFCAGYLFEKQQKNSSRPGLRVGFLFPFVECGRIAGRESGAQVALSAVPEVAPAP
jgi:hypothetical protein